MTIQFNMLIVELVFDIYLNDLKHTWYHSFMVGET